MALFHSLAVMPVAPMTSALLAPSPLVLIASLTLLKSSGPTVPEPPPAEEAPIVAAHGRVDSALFLMPLARGAFFLLDLPVARPGASTRLFSASLTAAEVLSLMSFSTSACSTFRGRHLPSESSYQKTPSRSWAMARLRSLAHLRTNPFGPKVHREMGPVVVSLAERAPSLPAFISATHDSGVRAATVARN